MRCQDIHPLSEHRARLSEHVRQVQETGRPMVITQNGRPAAVLLSPGVYDELVRAADVAAIKQGMAGAADDQGQDAKDVLRRLADKHKLNLDR